MAQKFLVALDRARLRIYRFSQQPGQFSPSIQPVDALDMPGGRTSFVPSHNDRVSRLPSANSRPGTLSAEERPVEEVDGERFLIEQLAGHISGFLDGNPHSPWHLAASSSLREKVIDALPESVRLRLDRVIPKDLINVPPAELREHFMAR